jgi:Domain of unknown function (DUF4442)
MNRTADNLRTIDVELRHRRWTQSLVRAQYGGSIFSMTDPFYVLMLIHNLGPEYIVWDKDASIKYLKPGRSKLHCEFRLTDEKLAEIRGALEAHPTTESSFSILVLDSAQDIVAEVEKTIHIRKRSSLQQEV